MPLLLLCTARPELYERTRPGRRGREKRAAHQPRPAEREETARLIASLLERAVLPAETQQALLERAGGNPLYAEEFVRLYADRGSSRGAAGEVPDTVQALIAARLDTLPPERKGLLQDAAVLGKVFWAGAVAEMGGRDLREVEHALHELSRKELVRSARDELDGRRGRVRLLARPGRDVCLLPDPSRRSRCPAPGGGSVDRAEKRASGPRTSPRCWRTTT